MSLVDFYIDPNKVCIFSKSNCGFCDKTKSLINNYKITPIIYELDKLTEGEILFEQLKSKTNQKTVPNIFINGKHIGGYTELCKLNNSRLLNNIINNFVYQCSFCGKSSYSKDIMPCKCISKPFTSFILNCFW